MAKKKVVEEAELVENAVDVGLEESTQPIINTKRALKSIDILKDFIWIPKEEIDLDNPTRFTFKMCTNSELAFYNDSLYKAEGTKILTCQSAVDLQMVKDKVFLIENVLTEDEAYNNVDIKGKNDIKDFFDRICPPDWISEMASYIRVVSAYRGEI